MDPLFADTSYFIALASPRDILHGSAVAWSRSLIRPLVTTCWVIQELADGMSARSSRHTFLRLLAAIEADEDMILIPFDQDLWRRGLDLYARRLDKEWSLTDCIFIVVMTDRGLTEALTGDHHFDQAGFRALLRSP